MDFTARGVVKFVPFITMCTPPPLSLTYADYEPLAAIAIPLISQIHIPVAHPACSGDSSNPSKHCAVPSHLIFPLIGMPLPHKNKSAVRKINRILIFFLNLSSIKTNILHIN